MLDRGWLAGAGVATALLLALSASDSKAPLRANGGNLVRQAEIPDGFVSASGSHKFLVPAGDPETLSRLESLEGVSRTIDYGSFRLLVAGDAALDDPVLAAAGATLRDDLDLVSLNGWLVDGRVGEPKDLPAARRQEPAAFDEQLYLVQFVGPTKDEWLSRIERREDARVVAYLPNGAFVVYGSPAFWLRASSYPTRPGSPVQWAAVYHPAYRISPYLDEAIERGDAAIDVVIQLVEHEGTEATVARLESDALARIAEDVSLAGMRDVRLRVPASRIEAIAALPDVFYVEPCLEKSKFDERQGQIMAGNVDATGSQPSAPGYLAWLAGKGFTSNFPFTVDVADDGFDRGSVSDINAEFRDAGGASRVTYVANFTSDPLGDGGAGHGNINCSIVGGLNDTQGNSAFEDSGLYQYGLGIAPHTRIGSTKIFSNAGAFTSTAYTTLISNAYNSGARISSNSWGLIGSGANQYTTDSRTYDILVRDAVSGTAGNQEMSIVFAAGNSGPGTNTVSAPGTGKNVFTIGASENFRQTGTDGCGIGNTGADNARDVISFSGRGPASDGRKKPDIQAPGTHIQGAASRSTVYDGSGVCNQYWPTGQTLYCWSSGTSHSTPAVAGAAALVRQYFANQGFGTPTPAMTKAFLMATTTYMTGVSANDTLPSNSQGYGRIDLGRAFDGTANVRVDQTQVLGATGATYVETGTIASGTKPFRVLLAWTDAPGTVGGNAWINNLDLEVTVNGTLYRGNVFSGANSITGGVADTRNNTEAVYLPAGTTGSFSITVRATAVNGDGVPGNADTTDQDFALFVYNGSGGAPSPDFTVAASPASRSVVQGSGTTYTATVTSVNGFSAATSLSVSGLPSGAAGSFSPSSVTPAAGGSANSTLSVTTGAATPAGTYTLTVTGTSGALVRSTTVSLTVTTAPVPDFTVSATPSTQTVVQGNGTSYTATVTSSNGFSSLTSLSVSGLPSGAAGSFSPASVTPPSGGSANSTLSVTTATSTPAGTYPLTITGTSGATVRTAGVTLVVNSAGGGSQVLTFSASPNSAVPDNNTTGTTSTVAVPNSMTITSVSVNTVITHPYKGDLEVALIGPDNTTVLLHNRTGGSADNVTTTFAITTASAQALTAFNGKNTSGSWRLRVRDLAAADVGTLNSWKVTFNGYSTLAPNLAIPDNNTTGVTSTINVAATGTVVSLRVRVGLTHTYQGDLEVALIGPDNTTVLLHNRTGAGTDNINTVYPDLTASAQSLAAFTGKSIAGAWRLRVRDLASADTGTLNSWQIDFRTN